MEPTWDAVHTTDDYYDGPRGGVADHGGQPHHYRSLFLDAEPYDSHDDRFELTPVSDDAVVWAQECSDILRRYHVAYRAGTAPVDLDDERVLPDDRTRRDELQGWLAAEVADNRHRTFVVRGEFGRYARWVRWCPVEPA